MSVIIKYALGLGGDSFLLDWVNTKMKKEIEKSNPIVSELEHIVDFLLSDKAPKRISRMSYKEAKAGAEKWTKALQKKGNNIKESKGDIEVIKEWEKEGFKFVKLIGENAYKREGMLMSSCVSSYYGKDDEIYSLRDKDNKPHCTISKTSQQIKGKGNGCINPKYIKYVVEFLEELGIEVRDSEMLNLGYVNIEDIKDKNAVYPNLFKKKYFYKNNDVLDKNGEKYENITLWKKFGLFEFDYKLNVKFRFSVKKCIYNFISLFNSNKQDYNEVAMQNSNKVAMEDSNEVAMEGSNKVAMEGSNKVAMEDYNEVAMEDYNKVAMQDYNKVAMEDYNEVAMEDYNKVAMEGYNEVAMQNSNEVAMEGYNKVAMEGYNEVAMQNSNEVAMEGYNEVAMQDYNEVAMQNSNEVAMQNSNKVAMQNYNIACGRYKNSITLGKKSIVLMGNESKVKGDVGSWMVFYKSAYNNEITDVEAVKIDGKKIKADTFYSLIDGKIVESLKDN